MKYCGNCGATNADEARFCIKCGDEFRNMAALNESVRNLADNKPPLLETKIIQVDNSPEVINASNEEWGAFGWSVQNIQVTHSQDTRTYTKNFSDLYLGTKTVETTTINYATIAYQRNKNMPNYHRILQLEKEYENLNAEVYIAQQECKYQPASIAKTVAGALFPMFGMYYFKERQEEKLTAERKLAEYNKTGYFETMERRKQEILDEASSLL